MTNVSLNLKALTAPDVSRELAIAIVMLWDRSTDDERNALKYGSLRTFFCVGKREERANRAPIPLDLILLLIKNGVFASIDLPTIQYSWSEETDVKTNFSPANWKTREEVRLGGIGARIVNRGKVYIVINCQGSETTVHPFGTSTLLPERFVIT